MSRHTESRVVVPSLADQPISTRWCPHHIRQVENTHTRETADFLLSSTRLSNVVKDHSTCIEATHCVASNVNEKHYTTRHIEDKCSCQGIAVPVREIVEVIASGDVPLISAKIRAEDATLSLQVVRRTPHTRYVAISHVWADGLGNPTSNALPLCVLKQMVDWLRALPTAPADKRRRGRPRASSKMLKSSSSLPLFWMDTLCIPVGAVFGESKVSAINRMASIYAGASQVLVLDQSLRKYQAARRTAPDVLAAILSSTWMTRSWTFQEGAIAREVYFQFNDVALDPVNEWSTTGERTRSSGRDITYNFPERWTEDHRFCSIYAELYNALWNKLRQSSKSSLSRDWTRLTPFSRRTVADADVRNMSFLRRMLHPVPSPNGAGNRRYMHMVKSESFRVGQLIFAWNELATRSTTKPEDIHVIMANLLDFSAAQVMAYKTEEQRMRAMLLSFDFLPCSLLFDVGPRTRNHGNTAQSLLPCRPSDPIVAERSFMEVSKTGLMLDLGKADGVQVLLLPRMESATGKRTIACHNSSTVIKVECPQDQPVALDRSVNPASCIILEKLEPNDAPEVPKSVHGALLHITGYTSQHGEQDVTTKIVLHAAYASPVKIQIMSDRGNRPANPHEDAVSLCEYCILKIDCGKCKPQILNTPEKGAYSVAVDNGNSRLLRRPIFLGPIQTGNGIAALIIVLFILPIIGCMVAFGVLMARNHGRLNGMTKGLLASFLLLYAAMIVFGATLYVAGISVARRTWLASFEDRWTEQMEDNLWWTRMAALDFLVQAWCDYPLLLIVAWTCRFFIFVRNNNEGEEVSQSPAIERMLATMKNLYVPEVFGPEENILRSRNDRDSEANMRKTSASVGQKVTELQDEIERLRRLLR